MMKPELPDSEAARLDTLRSLDLLDTPPEERFDRVTRLARRLFGVPIALVPLVDENRQWFKSRQGLDATETPREVSFCGHAILEDHPFVVTDASADARFVDNPLVTEIPSIRFYAGHPLAAPNGERLGTLCVIDRAPRSMSDEDFKSLRDLAALVEGEIAAIQTATTDPLTGLSNRRGFHLLAQKSFELCRRLGTAASLLFADMDGFKAINDELGHEEGDRALVDFAAALLETFRESDVVARLGGDEFVVLVSGAQGVATQEAARRLEDNLRRRLAEGARLYRLRFTLGIATFDPERHATLQDLLRDADRSMYEKKRRRGKPPAPTVAS